MHFSTVVKFRELCILWCLSVWLWGRSSKYCSLNATKVHHSHGSEEISSSSQRVAGLFFVFLTCLKNVKPLNMCVCGKAWCIFVPCMCCVNLHSPTGERQQYIYMNIFFNLAAPIEIPSSSFLLLPLCLCGKHPGVPVVLKCICMILYNEWLHCFVVVWRRSQ